MSARKESVRIASGQGFWGDWLEAPVRQVEAGHIDYLVMDYLAEVTMSIMQKQRARDPSAGYARDFVPLMGRILPEGIEKGIRVIANAGGVNPLACRDAVMEAAREAGLAGKARIGVITGDDLMDRLDDLLAEGGEGGEGGEGERVELRNMETGEPLSSV
ncbi:MAG: acyclic terpene utilization AtuA family protein, partial [Gemmatimonadota bacterium]